MIKLPNIESFEDEYYEVVKPIFENVIKRIKKYRGSKKEQYKDLKSYFTCDKKTYDQRLRMIICGKKNDLSNIIGTLKVMKDYKVKKGSKQKKVKYTLLKDMYDNFCKTSFGKKWALKVGVTTCPYCNRSYITTLKDHSVRPEYDHFYPKSLYPYLCVSMYNLIPSCSVCNNAKFTYDSHARPFLYPYEEEFGEDAVFELKYDDKILDLFENKYSVVITNKATDSSLYDKIEANKRELHLEDLYDMNHEYINHVLKLRYIYSDDHIKQLLGTYASVFSDIASLKDVLFLTRLSKSSWGDFPLSKLTKDIIDFYDLNQDDILL